MTQEQPRILVVMNSSTSGLGRLGDWLVQEDTTVELVAGRNIPNSLSGYHGVVLLGGGFMPDDDATGPWLPLEREITREALHDELPFLGICLGEQVLALVTGGEVTEASGETERGSVGVNLLPEAEQDRLFSPLAGEQLRMIQNHQDSVTALPDEAVLLGTNEACRVQAFRVGEAAWGLQFHPEVGAERLRTWDEASLTSQGIDKEELARAAEADSETNRRQSQALAASFAAVVHDYAGTA